MCAISRIITPFVAITHLPCTKMEGEGGVVRTIARNIEIAVERINLGFVAKSEKCDSNKENIL